MKVVIYRDESGDSPFRFWLSSLRDKLLVERISLRMFRIGEGNFGDHKYLQNGVWELRMTFGGGIRIYYGIHGNEVVLLLNGGDKSSQQRDIKKQVKLWQNFIKDK